MKIWIEIAKTVVVLAFCALVLILAGCATVYEIERTEAGVTTKVTIKSRREFSEGLSMRYDRELGVFEFSANQVSTHVSPLESAAADIIRALPQLTAPTVPE